MPRGSDRQNSILIVSDSGQFEALVKKALRGFLTIDVRKSGALARRCILERDYDIIVINSPLSDESGVELALDLAEKSNASLLLVSPQEIYEDVLERVTDSGVLVVSSASSVTIIDKAVRFMLAINDRMKELEKKVIKTEEKLEELRIVSKAKVLLVEKKNMSEDNAHRFIGKIAMNNGVSRRRAAEKVLEELE